MRSPSSSPWMTDAPSSLQRAAARNLVTKYLKVRPGESVVVESWSHTLSMATSMVDEVRRAGGRAFLAYENDESWWGAVDRGQAGLVGSLSEPEWAALGAADAYVQFWGPSDSARLARLPEKKMDDWATGWFDRWYKTAKSTGLRGGRMATGWVTDTRARKWGVNKDLWLEGILRACLADPKVIAGNGKRLARALRGGEKVRITHPNGTDLEVALAAAPARVFDGYPHPRNTGYGPYDLMANFPEGRLRVALDSKTAEGRFVASAPAYEEVWFPWERFLGGSFEFSAGKLTAFSFEQGGPEFSKLYAHGTPGKDRTGSLRIGLHPTVHDVPYLEELERGCVQLSVGGNSYVGGKNPSNFCGRLTLTGAEISVDGTTVVRGGKIF